MRSKNRAALAAVWCAALVAVPVSSASADPISYQGRITDGGGTPDGSYDINFQLFNAGIGGSPVGSAMMRTVVLAPEDNGVFAFDDIDFGDGVFTGEDRWIEVSVRTTGGGAFTTLGPRQAVRAVPYALHAQSAAVSLDDAFRNGNTIFNQGLGPVVFQGLVHFGQASAATSFAQFFMSASPTPTLQFGSMPGFGGQTRWFDESGATIGLIEGDPGGEGLAMRLVGDGGVLEWDADLGPTPGSGSKFFVTGPSSSFMFNTSLIGDDALELPIDAVSSAEILDEPGLASDTINMGTTLNANFQSVISRTITVPGPGNVIVLANGALAVQRLTNSNGLLVMGVSDVPNALPDTQQNILQIPPIGLSGFYNWPASAHGVFEVPVAGTYTYYFNANSVGFGQPRIFDPNLTLLYIPTTYGDVTPTLLAPDGGYATDAATRDPMTDAEILQEQLREQARALEQMKADQAAMRAQLLALQAESEANRAASDAIQPKIQPEEMSD